MSEGLSGPEPGEAAQADQPNLAERLIRDEFSEPTSVHRVRGTHATAEVPVVSADPLAADVDVGLGAVAAPAIHEEFSSPRRAARTRSHRTGMLAGLGVVGVLLAVLVIVGPGGSKPHLPAQSVHDVSPISASGPRTEAATTPSTTAPSTTSSLPTVATTIPPHQNQTVSTYITYVLEPGTTTPTATQPTTAPAAATTTSPAPAATTTTLPPTTSTTHRCTILGLLPC